MDYNYVRMRNARSAGDKSMAVYYEKLYKKGISVDGDTKLINILLVILLAVAVALGVYIGYEKSAAVGEDVAAVTSVNINI